MEQDPAVNGLFPSGFINTDTPQFATTNIGYFPSSTDSVAQVDTDPIQLVFAGTSSWKNGSWTYDLSGALWTCQTQGIYQFTVSMPINVFNTAETVLPVVTLYCSLTTATTIEFNQTLVSSTTIPITTGSALNLNMNVTGYVNADVGSTMEFFVVDESGTMNLIAGNGPFNSGYMSFQLMGQGIFGNSGVL